MPKNFSSLPHKNVLDMYRQKGADYDRLAARDAPVPGVAPRGNTMTEELVLSEQRGAVLVLTFNRPRVLKLRGPTSSKISTTTFWPWQTKIPVSEQLLSPAPAEDSARGLTSAI